MLPAALEPVIEVGFVVYNNKTKERLLEWPALDAFDFIAGLISEQGTPEKAKAAFSVALDRWRRRV